MKTLKHIQVLTLCNIIATCMQDELASTEVTQYYYTNRRDLGNVVNRDSKQGQKGGGGV